LGKFAKILNAVLGGRADANVRFADLVQLLEGLRFQIRIRGDHHIFTKNDVEEIINLQPKGSMAKPYQVRQVRNLILRYKLEAPNEE
jgi:hypothetical protein